MNISGLSDQELERSSGLAARFQRGYVQAAASMMGRSRRRSGWRRRRGRRRIGTAKISAAFDALNDPP